MKPLFFSVLCLIATLVPVHGLVAQLSGGSYEIYGDTFSFVSTGEASGGVYTLFSTGGEFFATSTSGGDYTLRAGFRAVEKGILRIAVTTSSIDLGIVTSTAVSSATTAIIVETDSATGYTLAVRQTGDLTNGVYSIDAVSDGTVTAGSEEYGVAVSGADVTVGTDIGMTTAPSTVATANGTISGNRTDVVFKLSVTSSTPPGAYTQTVQFLATVNP